jgi:hypothetical protein
LCVMLLCRPGMSQKLKKKYVEVYCKWDEI